MARRVNKEAIGSNETLTTEHNLLAGAKKTIPMIGYLNYIGSGSGADTNLPKGTLVACYNNSGTAAFFKMSTAAIGSDPSAVGAGVVQLKPNDYTILSIGLNTVVRSSANVTLYELVDSSQLLED